MTHASRVRARLSETAPAPSALPPSRAPLSAPWRAATAMIVALYLVFACLHAWWTPTGQTGYQDAPDEASHVTYVRTVAHGHLPTENDPGGQPGVWQSYEWHQPPLYYALCAPLAGLGARAIRAVSILLGLAALALVYLAGRELWPDDPAAAVLALGMAALIPSHIALSSVVNNDIALEVCMSGALYVAILCLMRGLTRPRSLLLGLLLAAAILTKSTGLLLAPLVALLFVACWRNGEPVDKTARCAGLCTLVAVALTAPWFVREYRQFGQFVPVRAFAAAFAGTVQARDVAAAAGGWRGYWRLLGWWTFESFWAVYGNARAAAKGIPLYLPDRVYWLAAVFSIAAFAGLTRMHFRQRDYSRSQIYAIRLLTATFALVLLSFVAFAATYFQAQGRYLYPAMLPICVLGAKGWRAVWPERYHDAASWALLAFLALLVSLYGVTIAP